MIRIAINGFGRIGRSVFRILSQRDDIQVVGINDLASHDRLAYLLRSDTIMGAFPGTVAFDAERDVLVVNGDQEVRFSAERDPTKLPWKALEVDIAIESTGVFRYREQIAGHLKAGAKKVILSVPPKDEVDRTIVLGVNDSELTKDDLIVSNASCTTNCLAPLAKTLHEKLGGIRKGYMTTIHAYTNDQSLSDMHHSDFRRSRAAAQNIIPTTTGGARAVGIVIPELAGLLDGIALRVPVPDGSVVTLTAEMKRDVTVEEVNAVLREAAEGELKGILSYSEDHLVSTDILGNPHSSILDSLCTQVTGGRILTTVAWYDN